MKNELHIADLFCGAGGTSAGAIEAVEMLGHRARLTAINHWDVAVATHSANHPGARHFCASLDSLNPRDLYKDGELDLLWASPECTHHSIARGGRPINDQSRATAWCVTRWAEALRPPVILIENVPEFATWGPIGSNGRPLASRKGEVFRAWCAALESLGYRVAHRVLCAADYGDPTTRRRLFIQAVRGRRRICWPEPTHAEGGDADLLSTRKPWVSAREIIQWEVVGRSIFRRKKPLAEKTMRRIWAGLAKFGITQPHIVTMEHGGGVRSAERPLPTITTAKGGAMGIAMPFLVKLRGGSDAHIAASAHGIDEPLGTVSTGGNHALAQPFLVNCAHGGERRPLSTNEPLPTITCNRGDIALCEPMLLGQQSCAAARPVSKPVPTVATAGAVALVEPFIIPHQNNNTVRPVSAPVPTVVADGHMNLIEPFLIEYYGNGSAVPVDRPLHTVRTHECHALCLPEIQIAGAHYLLDIKFRVLLPSELAAAQGFRRDYKFIGNKTEQVRQIGNAVPRNLARSLVLAALSQQNDISQFIHSS
ncbi:MAG: DNA cytosine methyltransferase [Opitutaceae bacterium]|jgi:DNA (cytosine-5)-methyltransferase 1|nr:DNA cytosine methyltransferase [Opitutaceae bacterium]